MSAEEKPVVQAASRELTDLAVAMRPDWGRDDLSGALVAAKAAGWSWERTFREVSNLLLDGDGRPADLRAAAARPARAGEQFPADGPSQAARARELYPNLRSAS